MRNGITRCIKILLNYLIIGFGFTELSIRIQARNKLTDRKRRGIQTLRRKRKINFRITDFIRDGKWNPETADALKPMVSEFKKEHHMK